MIENLHDQQVDFGLLWSYSYTIALLLVAAAFRHSCKVDENKKEELN